MPKTTTGSALYRAFLKACGTAAFDYLNAKAIAEHSV